MQKDLTSYYDGARALSAQMGTALTRVWRETREVAQTVVRDFTDERTREQVGLFVLHFVLFESLFSFFCDRTSLPPIGTHPYYPLCLVTPFRQQ